MHYKRRCESIFREQCRKGQGTETSGKTNWEQEGNQNEGNGRKNRAHKKVKRNDRKFKGELAVSGGRGCKTSEKKKKKKKNHNSNLNAHTLSLRTVRDFMAQQDEEVAKNGGPPTLGKQRGTRKSEGGNRARNLITRTKDRRGGQPEFWGYRFQ